MAAVNVGEGFSRDQWKRVFRVMKRFLSNATNKIDAKGRVSVPSVFRSVLSERAIPELYCFQDFVFPAISIGGLDLLDRFEQQIAAEDPFSSQANQMSLLIHGGGVFMKLDAEGRLMVTDFIRDFTGITDEVTFVGRADYFQLWEPQAFQALQATAREERRLAGMRSWYNEGTEWKLNLAEIVLKPVAGRFVIFRFSWPKS